MNKCASGYIIELISEQLTKHESNLILTFVNHERYSHNAKKHIVLGEALKKTKNINLGKVSCRVPNLLTEIFSCLKITYML